MDGTSPLRKPRPLQPGDNIRLVSPSSPMLPERLERMLAWLGELGYQTELARHALDQGGHTEFLAGLDQDRAQDLTDAFLDPRVDAVLCTRGGYGAARLLPYLDFPKLAAANKLFLGFSDITTLHLGLNACGLPTLHAPMALSLNWERVPWVYESFQRALVGDHAVPETAPAGRSVVGGKAEGVVTGGCLVLLSDAIGTRYSMQAKGKIVLIEDVDEPPHRVDGMLTHFLNAGVLDGVAGIVVGEMTRSEEKVDETIGAADWRTIITERLAPLRVPMIMDYPFGHAKGMLTLPLGLHAELDAGAGTLTYTESICS